jgi:hypothetical protein
MAYPIQYTSKPTGGNAPTIIPSASTSTIPASVFHIVALDNGANQAHFENNSSTFSKMRVTIHTTGAWQNSPHSDNHVTIILILNQGGAVQVDMRTDDGDRRGQLVWKLVGYEHSASEIKCVDYDLGAPVAVKTLYKAIRYEWKSHQYLFSSGGSGCHYWKYEHFHWLKFWALLLTWRSYTLLYRMASDTTRFSLHSEVPAHAWAVFGKWYSRTGTERPNQPILQGEFQSDEQWYQDWYGEDDEEDNEEE